MSAVRKVHAHDRIARFQHGEIDGEIRLRAAVRLHVAMIATEKLFQPFARQLLGDVYKLAAAVIAFCGIPFGIFVGKVTSHRRHHGGRNDILACNEFEIAALTGKLFFHCRVQFGIGLFDTR